MHLKSAPEASGKAQRDILDRAAPPPPATVRYGPRPEHVIDLWLPPGQPGPRNAPLIVLIHGGFWRPAFDRTHLRPMAQALAADGNVVAVPEYRRAGMAEEGWTGTFDDIAAALDQAGPLAEPYGADLGHLTWAGHSAGGHLALWAAARPGLPASSPWRGPCPATHVVSLAGCNSLRMCAEWNLGAGAVRNLMGGGPDEVPERYAVADPAALPPPPVPVTLVHGTDDDTVPLAMSELLRAGRLVAIPGAGHFDLIDPLSPAWPQVLAVLTGIVLPSLKRAVPPAFWRRRGHSILVSSGRPEPYDQFGRHATAVLHFDTLGLGPLANFGGVEAAGRRPAATPGRPPGRRRAAAPPRGLDVLSHCLPQCRSVLCVQVDLIVRTIQRKADGTLGRTAVDVINEQGLNLLGHVHSVPLV